MKKIIEGKAYNTETATLLGSTKLQGREPDGAGLYSLSSPKVEVGASSLYQTRGGAYFLVREVKEAAWGDADHIGGNAKPVSQPGLYPLSRKEALTWAEQHFDADKIEAMFGEIAEAGTKSGSILLRVPAALKAQMETAAKGHDQSVNAWAMRCLEVCAKRSDLIKALAVLWWDLGEISLNPEIFTPEGHCEIVAHAAAALGDAFRALGIDDIMNDADFQSPPALCYPNWKGREHSEIHVKA